MKDQDDTQASSSGVTWLIPEEFEDLQIWHREAQWENVASGIKHGIEFELVLNGIELDWI